MTSESAHAPLELSVVMPVYNEEGAIEGVLRAWSGELDRLGIAYEIRVYDDGSRDGTRAILDRLAEAIPRLVPLGHANRGHGPTILRGYGEARGAWVFQLDSDGEIGPEGFEPLWSVREEHDFLFGVRHNRAQPTSRRLITGVSRITVRLLFGRGIADVNTPYRLMRGERLAELLEDVPADTFAPNVALSGLALARGLRVYERPVEFRSRVTGTVSIVKWRLLRAAARSFAQTVRIGLRAKGKRSA